MELVVNPPKKGDESFNLYIQERDAIMGSLKRKAVMLYEKMNKMTNVQCNYIEGSMYGFPQVKFSEAA